MKTFSFKAYTLAVLVRFARKINNTRGNNLKYYSRSQK